MLAKTSNLVYCIAKVWGFAAADQMKNPMKIDRANALWFNVKVSVLPVQGENLAQTHPLGPADLRLIPRPRILILSWALRLSQENLHGCL